MISGVSSQSKFQHLNIFQGFLQCLIDWTQLIKGFKETWKEKCCYLRYSVVNGLEIEYHSAFLKPRQMCSQMKLVYLSSEKCEPRSSSHLVLSSSRVGQGCLDTFSLLPTEWSPCFQWMNHLVSLFSEEDSITNFEFLVIIVKISLQQQMLFFNRCGSCCFFTYF